VTAPIPADAFDRAGQRMADRVNPIVVKEIRQGLRTRTFWVFFALMLLACLVISLIAFATADGVGNNGRYYFFAYYLCLGLVQFFVIPYSAYRSMSREREEETWVLLTLTGIGPHRILRGKMGSFMLQGLIYASAAAPFLLFSYYLNGIDLPTIVLTVISGATYQLFLTSVAVSAATLAESKIVRGLLHFLVLGFLAWGLITGLTSTFGLLEAMRTLWTDDAAIVTACASIFGMLTWAVLLYESAAARMALATESYARGPRLAFIVQVIGAAIFFVWGAAASGEKSLYAIGAITLCAHILAVGAFVASDRDGMARSLWLKGSPRSLLKPGALRGYRLVLALLTALTVLFAALNAGALDKDQDKHLFAILGAPAYAMLYLSLPIVLSRMVRHAAGQTAILVRIFFLGLFVFGSGMPPLLAALLKVEPDHFVFNLLNPVVGLVNLATANGDSTLQLVVLYAATLIAIVIAHSVLVSRDNPPAKGAAA
jgi:hypothetical protein